MGKNEIRAKGQAQLRRPTTPEYYQESDFTDSQVNTSEWDSAVHGPRSDGSLA